MLMGYNTGAAGVPQSSADAGAINQLAQSLQDQGP